MTDVAKTAGLIVVLGILGAAMIMGLGGCAEADTSKCLRYGFTPHTDGYSNCMMTLELHG